MCSCENGEDFGPSFTGEGTDNGNLVKLSNCEVMEAQLKNEESASLIQGIENNANDDASDQEEASIQLISAFDLQRTELFLYQKKFSLEEGGVVANVVPEPEANGIAA
ncbi:uncharacterized protein TNCV_1034891 [Trichonephila clavipes]|nr:uncharacterized protein TNCV_1034891 [Trichonephila clavipes]